MNGSGWARFRARHGGSGPAVVDRTTETPEPRDRGVHPGKERDFLAAWCRSVYTRMVLSPSIHPQGSRRSMHRERPEDVDNDVVTAVHQSMSALALTTYGDALTVRPPRSHP